MLGAFWVLHSPYPDGTWRGLEKCVEVCLNTQMQPMRYDHTHIPEHPMLTYTPLLFESEELARAFAEKHGTSEFFVPVQVSLSYPDVRKPLTSSGE